MEEVIAKIPFLDPQLGRRRRPFAPSPNDPIRELGPFEKYYALEPLPRMVAMVISVRGPAPDLDTLSAAMSRLAALHPMLAVAVDLGSPSEEPRFIHLIPRTAAGGPLPFPFVRSAVRRHARANAETANELLERELNRPIDISDRQAPLWRLHLVSGPAEQEEWELVLVWHHAIMDGMSGVLLFRKLLGLLKAADPVHAAPASIVPPASVPCAEDCVDLRPQLSSFLSHAYKAFAPWYSEPYWTGPEPPVDGGEPRTSMLHCDISPELWAQLDVRAKKEGVTQHSALAAAAQLAIARLSPLPITTSKCTTPLSLRARCALPAAPALPSNDPIYAPYDPSLAMDDRLGLFIAATEITQAVSREQELWDVAREYHAFLRQNATRHSRAQGLLRFVNLRSYLSTRTNAWKNGRSTTVEVTNLGNLVWSDEGPLRVASAAFCQTIHEHGAVFVHHVTASNGAPHDVISFPAHLVSKDAAERYAELFLAALA